MKGEQTMFRTKLHPYGISGNGPVDPRVQAAIDDLKMGNGRQKKWQRTCWKRLFSYR